MHGALLTKYGEQIPSPLTSTDVPANCQRWQAKCNGPVALERACDAIETLARA